MVDQYTAPVNHTTGSAVGTTAAGTAVGGIKGGVKAGVGWMASAIGVGALVGLGLATGGLGFLASSTLWSILAGATAGGLLGSIALPLVAGVGAAYGGFNGGEKAINRVHDERGAAAAVQAQIDMIKAQNPAVAGTTIYAPSATNDNKYTLPAQGTQFNAAPAQIQGNALQYDGVASGPQLAASR